jgi:hypothetical protein
MEATKNEKQVTRRMTRRWLRACRRNLRKARKALKQKPFEMTVARAQATLVNLRKMQEANRGHYRSTPARRRANLENIAQAWEANRGDRYRPTEARRKAARLNAALARAAPRSPEMYAYTLRSNLLHGQTVRHLEESVPVFGEDPKEFQANRRRMARALAPQDEVERRVVERLADVVWLRLRLYRGQARWEAGMLSRLLRKFPRQAYLDADETRERADLLLEPFIRPTAVFRYEDGLLRRIERVLRYLLRYRGRRDFWTRGHMPPSERRAIEAPELMNQRPHP